MSLTLPPAVNYPSPLIPLITRWNNAPSEGPKCVPCEIDWASMGGVNKCVSMQLYGGAAQTLSQILAISYDNSASGADVMFVFPDTSQVYTVPAYEPAGVMPVFTNALSFYVICPTAQSEDITRFSIHNSLPPPSSLSVSKEQSFATSGTIGTANGTTLIIPATVSGTIEALNIGAQFNGGANGSAVAQLVDGGSNVVWTGQCSSNNSINVNLQLANLNDLSVRFNGGLSFVVTNGGSPLTGSGNFAVNVYFRTP